MSSGRSKSLLYDPQVRSLFFQAALAIAVIVMIIIAIGNAGDNLEAQGKSFGFGYFIKPAPGAIATSLGTWAMGYEPNVSPVWVAYCVGIINTLAVAALGIITATFLGVLLGVFRLSSNFVLRSFATLYVEVLRNIPLLLQILFWMKITRLIFPSSKKFADAAPIIPGAAYINSDGIRIPYLDWHVSLTSVFLVLLVAVLIAIAIMRFLKHRQELTGQQSPRFLIGVGVASLICAVVFVFAGNPLTIEWPSLLEGGKGLNAGAFDKSLGGLIVPEFLGLYIALSTYTASFIAEIVRAGIMAVAKGQSEAAGALGLSASRTLTKVVLPQALRVIIPPMTSQYLNLTKNSSLATVVGYIDFVAISDRIRNKEGVEMESIIVIILVYLTISLLTSAFMNWFNSRTKLVER